MEIVFKFYTHTQMYNKRICHLSLSMRIIIGHPDNIPITTRVRMTMQMLWTNETKKYRRIKKRGKGDDINRSIQRTEIKLLHNIVVYNASETTKCYSIILMVLSFYFTLAVIKTQVESIFQNELKSNSTSFIVIF